MSFEQGRETLDTVPTNTSDGFRNDGDLPPPPQSAGENTDMSTDGETRERLDRVLMSDIGVTTLLNRLKQSVGSARDFASFLKERSSLEEKHAQGLKKLSRSTHDAIRRPESRGGSFAQNYEEIVSVHDRMAGNGLQFANTLHQMYDELEDMASNCERGRKHWKQTGLNAEKRVQDAEQAMDKARGKYNTLADQYDRARTGERQSGKFGLKGPKSAAQQEEDLHRKVDSADTEYATRVQAAQAHRQELLSIHRPQAIRALEDLIRECDAALSMQMQKFAALNEKLLLTNGLCVSPLKSDSDGMSSGRGLREIAHSIDNQRDFHEYVLGFSNKAGNRASDIKYEKHPALSPKTQQQSQQESFDTSQPQFGTPGRTNTGADTYSPGHRPTQSGQISGVLPYERSGGDRMRSASQGQYPTSSFQTPQPNNAQLPQLPRMETLNMGNPLGSSHGQDTTTPGATVTPSGLSTSGTTGTPGLFGASSTPAPSSTPGTDSRQPQYGTQSRSDQPAVAGSGANLPSQVVSSGVPGPAPHPLSPVSSMGTHSQVTEPPKSQQPSYSSGVRSDGPGGPRPGDMSSDSNYPSNQAPSGPNYQYGQPPSGSGHQPDSRSFSMGQIITGAGSRGPSLGQVSDFGPHSRGPSMGQAGMTQTGMEPGSTGTSGMSSSGAVPGSRGPSLGQPGDFKTDNRSAPPYAQGGYQQTLPRGPSLPQSGGYAPIQNEKPGPISSTGPSGVNEKLSQTQRRADGPARSLPPLKPVFGVPLDELFRRDGAAVPTIVYQCIQAVDLFGLQTEGIYRTSGSAPHIMDMKALFDHDSSQVDFRNPATFHHDIASVTTLLKHFFRDLPDPLLTSASYQEFINAAKIDDDIQRRDGLHAIINALPDPNYATLRVLVLHLFRVAQHSDKNRMTNSNLAICFGPTIMGQASPSGSAAAGVDIRDAGWQARVVETILNNTFQIFDGDE